jgi:REP element-mobilizing transposase RayT
MADAAGESGEEMEIVTRRKKANTVLGRTGTFWQGDYFDTYMRDEAHYRQTVRYIENNPTKARLVRAPEEWRWSSARYRGERGRWCRS